MDANMSLEPLLALVLDQQAQIDELRRTISSQDRPPAEPRVERPNSDPSPEAASMWLGDETEAETGSKQANPATGRTATERRDRAPFGLRNQTPSEGKSGDTRPRLGVSRGHILKAALATAAAAVAADRLATPARADDGDSMKIGGYTDDINYSQTTTVLSPSSWKLAGDGFAVFVVTDNQKDAVTLEGTYYPAMVLGATDARGDFTTGVVGYVTNPGTGVLGIAGTVGVRGHSGNLGVQGECPSGGGTGMYGLCYGGYGYGVIGRSLNSRAANDFGVGFGVLGESGGGVGVQGNGTTGTGVVGTATSGRGVSGTSQSGYGVFGSSHTTDSVRGEVTNTASTASGVFGLTTGSGAGVWGDLEGSGLAGVIGRTLTKGAGVYGQAWTGTGDGVYGEVIPADSQASAIHGRTHGKGAAVTGESLQANNPTAAIFGTTKGTSAGVWGDLDGSGIGGVVGRSLTQGAGVYGQAWTGTGSGVHGEVIPKNSTSPAVSAHNFGKGPGVLATSDHARGVVASGKLAPLRLIPSEATTHPATGAVGDLFVDASGRLWYCKATNPVAWVRLV